MFQFDSFAHFMAMDGHGVYVWASYAITFAVMAFIIVSPLLRARQTLKAVKLQQARSARHNAAQTSSQ
ncbi:MAG: heme exporter protein CcmD [Porticoccaceae bacterium]|jgi:heme exporter protein D|nr:heme exporter protein CcmD [Porticoccaceae bacterium]